MKFVSPIQMPPPAKLVEIANGVEAVQDGRTSLTLTQVKRLANGHGVQPKANTSASGQNAAASQRVIVCRLCARKQSSGIGCDVGPQSRLCPPGSSPPALPR